MLLINYLFLLFLVILIHVREKIEETMQSKKCQGEGAQQICINATIVVPSFCSQTHRRIVLQGTCIIFNPEVTEDLGLRKLGL